MIFSPTPVDGAVLVEVDFYRDHRGSFARTYCLDEFADHGMALSIVQTSFSRNAVAGTLRGLHFQAEPAGEPKLVRCTRGQIFDVAADLRPSSATYGKWAGVTLDAEEGNALFIPQGCAHGFLTMTPSTEVSYSMGARHVPGLGRGVRWDDPVLGIDWPFPPAVMSERDATLPYLIP